MTSRWWREVGPIWNNNHAKEVAQGYIASHPHLEWTGHWRTITPNEMSVIEVKMKSWDVEVGPIRDNNHAKKVADAYLTNHPELEWTGHWKTTVPGQMSVIGVSHMMKVTDSSGGRDRPVQKARAAQGSSGRTVPRSSGGNARYDDDEPASTIVCCTFL